MSNFDVRESGSPHPEGTAFAANLSGLNSHTPLASQGLNRAVKAIEPGDFLLDRHFVPGISDLIVTSQFIEVPDHGLTRGASSRMAVFGQLILKSVDDGQHSVYVALKPFNEVEEATHEFAVAAYFADGHVEGLDTFTPLGFHRLLDTGQPALITHYRHSVRSLDTIFKNPDIINNLNEPDNAKIVAKGMGRAATTASGVHDKGWTHGDFRARNTAWDVLSGKTMVIDLETAAPFPRSNGSVDVEAAKEATGRDLAMFVGSVFESSDDAVLPDMLRQHFALPYAGKRGTDASSRLTFEEIDSIIEAEAVSN